MATTHGIKLDDETGARLKALGKKRNRSPHWLMRTAIEDYLVREERYEREIDEDMARWDAYLLTGKAVDGDKAEAWLAKLAAGKSAECPK